ncbi:MAG TPA: flotillin family protein, partial [Candidatus Sumerlaeota bacterium]|nr:flotillin family protein [Candidatus Sumerlaeota bacterium]
NRAKAESWQYYNQAAIAELLIAALPQIAEKVATPLSKTDKITIVSNGNSPSTGAAKITRDVSEIIASLPPIVENLTGVQLAELLKKLPGVKEEYKEVKDGGDDAKGRK